MVAPACVHKEPFLGRGTGNLFWSGVVLNHSSTRDGMHSTKHRDHCSHFFQIVLH